MTLRYPLPSRVPGTPLLLTEIILNGIGMFAPQTKHRLDPGVLPSCTTLYLVWVETP